MRNYDLVEIPLPLSPADVRAWLKTKPERDPCLDPMASDFIDDMRGDAEVIRRFTQSLTAVHDYLSMVGACEGARDGATEAWHAFKEWVRK
jgi:hypothetical protein